MAAAAKNTGILGGAASTWADRLPMLRRYIRPLPGRDLGLKAQCRCGGTVYAKWRGRWYCKRCGRWVRRFAHVNPEDDHRTDPEGDL